MSKKPKLDSYHYHEMLDRLNIVTQIADQHLQQHPVAKIESDIGSLITEAIDKLTVAYQLTGEKSFKNKKN